jgi:hypothetical protein
MAKAPKLYTRLTRSPLQIGTYKSLWLAEDHFMQVESSGYSESYQRFQFSDVQGFFIQASNRRLYWNLFWSLWALVAVIPFIFALVEEEMPGASLVFLIIATAFLLWNNLLGPSCRVYLVTKVQTLHLAGVARRRKANSVLGRLQPLIERAQSSLVMPTTAATVAATVATGAVSSTASVETTIVSPAAETTAAPTSVSAPASTSDMTPPVA